jgi:hypothetical protein
MPVFDQATISRISLEVVLPRYLTELVTIAVEFIALDRHDDYIAAIAAMNERFMETLK